MLRKFLHLFALISLVGAPLCLWIVNFQIGVSALWTVGTVRYEVYSGRGELMLCRHSGWLWNDPLPFDLIRTTRTFSVKNAVGWRPEKEYRFIGLSCVIGKSLTSFRCSQKNPRAMIRATTQFRLLIIQEWRIVWAGLLIDILLARTAFRDMWKNRHQSIHPRCRTRCHQREPSPIQPGEFSLRKIAAHMSWSRREAAGTKRPVNDSTSENHSQKAGQREAERC